MLAIQIPTLDPGSMKVLTFLLNMSVFPHKYVVNENDGVFRIFQSTYKDVSSNMSRRILSYLRLHMISKNTKMRF